MVLSLTLNVLNPLTNILWFSTHWKRRLFINIVEKGENAGDHYFLLFPQFFSTLQTFLYPPKLCLGGYIGVSLSVGRSVRPLVGL